MWTVHDHPFPFLLKYTEHKNCSDCVLLCVSIKHSPFRLSFSSFSLIQPSNSIWAFCVPVSPVVWADRLVHILRRKRRGQHHRRSTAFHGRIFQSTLNLTAFFMDTVWSTVRLSSDEHPVGHIAFRVSSEKGRSSAGIQALRCIPDGLVWGKRCSPTSHVSLSLPCPPSATAGAAFPRHPSQLSISSALAREPRAVMLTGAPSTSQGGWTRQQSPQGVPKFLSCYSRLFTVTQASNLTPYPPSSKRELILHNKIFLPSWSAKSSN